MSPTGEIISNLTGIKTGDFLFVEDKQEKVEFVTIVKSFTEKVEPSSIDSKKLKEKLEKEAHCRIEFWQPKKDFAPNGEREMRQVSMTIPVKTETLTFVSPNDSSFKYSFRKATEMEFQHQLKQMCLEEVKEETDKMLAALEEFKEKEKEVRDFYDRLSKFPKLYR